MEVGDAQEQAAFDGATDLYRKGQYKDAAESLAAFIALYPNSQLAPTAQFYLGSARYASRDYKGAIEQLNNLLQKSPDNARAPDALLVIAGSQIELNNRAGAKTTLQRIVRDYPNSGGQHRQEPPAAALTGLAAAQARRATSAASAPVMAANCRGVRLKTACGWPAAAHRLSYWKRSRSNSITGATACPMGQTPPMA